MGEIAVPVLLKKGAEASLFLAEWHGKWVVMKTRFAKKYRHPQLDNAIRSYRTAKEPQLMSEAKRAGVPTPLVLQVDLKNASIVMEFVEGHQVKQLLGELSTETRKDVCVRVGELIGRLHYSGVIHGDLTTSNMIQTADDQIFLVDFGLGEKSNELEARGVDLHLMKRALQSAHFKVADECFTAIAKGYASVLGEESKDVLAKVGEIERRGRYVADRQQAF